MSHTDQYIKMAKAADFLDPYVVPTLQSILESLPQDPDKDALRILFKLNHFREEFFKTYTHPMSMEELVLRYAAWSKFKMSWDGERWTEHV